MLAYIIDYVRPRFKSNFYYILAARIGVHYFVVGPWVDAHTLSHAGQAGSISNV